MSKSKSRNPRPTRPTIPGSASFEALDHTHVEILKMLDQLARLVDHIEKNGLDATARQLAAHIRAFFEGTSREHHAAEEQFVFPGLLSGSDPSLIHHVQRLRQDHGWIEEDWLELSPQLEAIADGNSGYDIDFLRAATPVFTDLLREHITLEETVVYPAGRQQQRGEAA